MISGIHFVYLPLKTRLLYYSRLIENTYNIHRSMHPLIVLMHQRERVTNVYGERARIHYVYFTNLMCRKT